MTTQVTSAAAEFARRQQSPLQRVQHQLHGRPWLSPLFLLLVAFVAFFIATPTFLTASSMGILLQQTGVVGALAVGQTIVILSAGIDLSVGAVMVLSMMVMATLGMEAIAKIARGGEKPQVSPGLDFFDTGVALVTDKKADGVDSITSDEGAKICWGN